MPMHLVGDNSKEFELALIPERLADVQDGTGDDAAATISFRVANGEAEWEETAPCINMFEFTSLAEWLEAIAAGGPGADAEGEPHYTRVSDGGHEVGEIDLLEPELNFQVLRDFGDSVIVRVRFHLRDRPDELALDPPTDQTRHIDLRVRREALRAAAAQLREDLRDFDRVKDDLRGEAEAGSQGTSETGLEIDGDEGRIVGKL